MTGKDIAKAIKLYRKLGCPSGLFDPTTRPFTNNKYNVIVTERVSGKTTNVILFGMCLNQVCGTITQYIRQTDEQLTPKRSKKLMTTIKACGYIEKITAGRWHDCYYHSREWHYCNYSEDGKIEEKDPTPFISCLSIDRSEDCKSVYNAPHGEWIVFDEFVSSRYLLDEFVSFCDLICTIVRFNNSAVCWMLGNTLDPHCEYFHEMELDDCMARLEQGEHIETITDKGTPIYLEWYSPEKSERRSIINRLFFGFNNRKLGAITGENWAITPAPRMKGKPEIVLSKNRYLQYNGRLLQLEICQRDNFGLCVWCHQAKNFGENAVIFTCDTKHDQRYRHKYGYDQIDNLIWTLYERDKFLYGTNADQSILHKYIRHADQL